jgi:topoisomerase-4 subunit A
MRVFKLSELQANAILDTRLRSLRKLEEMELKRELQELTSEKEQTESLLANPATQWKTVAWQIREVKKSFGPDTALGKRRTVFQDAPDTSDLDFAEAMVEREPITVMVSQKGWIRSMKGHVADLSGVQFKGDDALKVSFFTETTAKILVVASNGKVFTLEASKLPGGRGFGDPIRLMVDFDEGADIVAAYPYKPGMKLLLVSTEGRGFVAAADEIVANTRKGKNVMSLDGKAKLAVAAEGQGDHVAIVGENRKLLIFPASQLPEMARGKGVRLQRYRDGGVSDAKTFRLDDGLTWKDSSGRTWTVANGELRDWIGNRAEAGRLPMKGFPKNNRFG